MPPFLRLLLHSTPRTLAPSHVSRWLGRWALLAGLWITLPYVGWQITFLKDKTHYDPDQFTLYPLSRYHDPELFQNDPIADYLLKMIPIGYEGMIRLFSLFADPHLLYAPLAALLWLSCLPPLWIIGKMTGGKANAIALLMIFACSRVFIFRINTGMPHSFAYPLLFWGTLAQMTGRQGLLAGLTVASAGFYPVATPILGLMLAWLTFSRFPWRSRPLPWRWLCTRSLGLACVALLCFVMARPLLKTDESMGRPLKSSEDMQQYPELEHFLYHIDSDWILSVSYWQQHHWRGTFQNYDQVTEIMYYLFLAGCLLAVRDRRLWPLFPSAAIILCCWQLSLNFMPDQAYRFAVYGLPVLIVILTPIAIRKLCVLIAPRRWGTPIALCAGLLYLWQIAYPDAKCAGYWQKLYDINFDVVEFAKTLPKDAEFAGFPGLYPGPLVDLMPFLAQRKALVTFAGHSLLHENHLLMMRKRTTAVMDAFFATDAAPLLRLRDEFGVDYFIVNTGILNSEEAPYYMPYFNDYALPLWSPEIKKPFYTETLSGDAIVFEKNVVRIIDLHALNP